MGVAWLWLHRSGWIGTGPLDRVLPFSLSSREVLDFSLTSSLASPPPPTPLTSSSFFMFTFQRLGDFLLCLVLQGRQLCVIDLRTIFDYKKSLFINCHILLSFPCTLQNIFSAFIWFLLSPIFFLLNLEGISGSSLLLISTAASCAVRQLDVWVLSVVLWLHLPGECSHVHSWRQRGSTRNEFSERNNSRMLFQEAAKSLTWSRQRKKKWGLWPARSF